MCSKLIVGINTDNSIRRLKGPSRPILNLQHRIAALESLSFIDQVIPFDEDTPIKLIEKIQPDILFKGADYKDKEVVGSEFVVSNGGSIIYLDFDHNISTSYIIDRVLSSSV